MMKGQGSGRGSGQGSGRGSGQGVTKCVCPNCGEEVPHQRGTPCASMSCPNCGTAMIGKR